jgi:hypothetical protein
MFDSDVTQRRKHSSEAIRGDLEGEVKVFRTKLSRL